MVRTIEEMSCTVVDLMIRFRDPVRVIQFAKRSRSRIVRSFVRSVEFPVALTSLSLTDSAENRVTISITPKRRTLCGISINYYGVHRTLVYSHL